MNASGELSAYGPLGMHVARALDPTEAVICFDETAIGAALRDALRRRSDGQTFTVRAALRSPDTARFEAVTASILSAISGIDERRGAFESAATGVLTVNNAPLAAMHAYAPASVRLLQAIFRLADGVIVTSEAERQRLVAIADTDFRAFIRPLRDAAIPAPPDVSSCARDAVVVWAPFVPGDVAAAFAIALADLRFPLLIIAGSAPRDAFGAHWFGLEDAAATLARARVIVDTTGYGADSARALAAWNASLVLDRDGGGQEHFSGVRSYDRRRFESVYEAVAAGLGGDPPRQRSQVVIEPVSAPMRNDGPLVSIVLPTFDRPDLLAIALQSIRYQTYTSIETIVAIDGGPPLDDLAAAYPEVRFLMLPGPNQPHSTNAAFSAARGQYIAFLNDDDLYFPDHLALLVAALERSGGAVAHGDVITAFLRKSDGAWTLYGLESNMSRVADRSSLLVSNRIGATSALIRRSAMGETMMDPNIPLYRDYGLWVRLADQHDFIHVERITSCYTIRDGAQQISNAGYDRALRSYEYLYSQYPVSGRPLLEARRAQILEAVKRGDMMIRATPAAEVAPLAWPPWSSP